MEAPETKLSGPPPVFELITIGDELLLGLTTNSHLAFIGSHVARRGVLLSRSCVVTDNAEHISRQVSESWAHAQVIITTGGLGPTCDDRTREAVAAVLGRRLVFDPAVEQAIRERFERLGRTMTPNNLRQAERPEGSEVLSNPNGTAPGIWFEDGGRVLVMLPGPPSELQPMFLDQVLPRLADRGLLGRGEAYLQIRTAGMGESMLETRLQPVFDACPGLAVAFCAHAGHVDVRLSAAGGGPPTAEIYSAAQACAEILQDDFVCYGHDGTALVVGNHLRRLGRKLAVAESCTGGMLSSAFTDIPGASRFFAGGVVCYSNQAKMDLLGVPECLLAQHGAVSAEAAVALATGAAERLEADYGLSITGFAGPGGGTVENPVGTVYIGLHSPLGSWSRHTSFPGSRVAIRTRAVNAALDWLRRKLRLEESERVVRVTGLEMNS